MDVKSTIKKKGYSMEQVASLMGISRVTLTQNLSRNPTIKTLQRIADTIGCNIGDFFADECRQADAFLAVIKDGDRCYTAHSVDELQKVTDEIKKSR